MIIATLLYRFRRFATRPSTHCYYYSARRVCCRACSSLHRILPLSLVSGTLRSVHRSHCGRRLFCCCCTSNENRGQHTTDRGQFECLQPDQYRPHFFHRTFNIKIKCRMAAMMATAKRKTTRNREQHNTADCIERQAGRYNNKPNQTKFVVKTDYRLTEHRKNVNGKRSTHTKHMKIQRSIATTTNKKSMYALFAFPSGNRELLCSDGSQPRFNNGCYRRPQRQKRWTSDTRKQLLQQQQRNDR